MIQMECQDLFSINNSYFILFYLFIFLFEKGSAAIVISALRVELNN